MTLETLLVCLFKSVILPKILYLLYPNAELA